MINEELNKATESMLMEMCKEHELIENKINTENDEGTKQHLTLFNKNLMEDIIKVSKVINLIENPYWRY